MIRWPDGPTSSDADSTFQIGRKKADEDQLQPTVRNTLRKLSRPTKKNCLTADRRLEITVPGATGYRYRHYQLWQETLSSSPCKHILNQSPPSPLEVDNELIEE
ncbi:hypothetical protein DPX16_13527 [Anabarilius grahami]|uniref:Uncharacterized protein n=1 Tax=Anabarilius grahami TaxID=495550 RepID=A0A3N0YBH2_ANAGA|nr:hypothetical protein DPX16_13527 [Anabarilius grahami]